MSKAPRDKLEHIKVTLIYKRNDFIDLAVWGHKAQNLSLVIDIAQCANEITGKLN